MLIDEAISTVKDVISLLVRSVEKNPRLDPLIMRVKNTLGFLVEQRRLATPIPKSLGDVSDLPEELLRELSVTKTDELEDQILTVVRACNGEANLGNVLIVNEPGMRTAPRHHHLLAEADWKRLKSVMGGYQDAPIF